MSLGVGVVGVCPGPVQGCLHAGSSGFRRKAGASSSQVKCSSASSIPTARSGSPDRSPSPHDCLGAARLRFPLWLPLLCGRPGGRPPRSSSHQGEETSPDVLPFLPPLRGERGEGHPPGRDGVGRGDMVGSSEPSVLVLARRAQALNRYSIFELQALDFATFCMMLCLFPLTYLVTPFVQPSARESLSASPALPPVFGLEF